MRFLFYTHSLVSDWNHGNAHFLRGVMRDLIARGHEAVALEPADGWSRGNLVAEQGAIALERFRSDFPELTSMTYGRRFPHEDVVAEADVVIVHEWTDPSLVARLGRCRARGGRFTLLFHDTHHRAVSAEKDIAALIFPATTACLHSARRCARTTSKGVGATGWKPGTRRQTHGCSILPGRKNATGTWCGSAIGVTANEAGSWRIIFSIPCGKTA